MREGFVQFIELAKKSMFDENSYKELEYYSQLAKEELILNYSDRTKVGFENAIRNLNLFYILKN